MNKTTSYIVAVIACIGVFIVYLVIGALLDWEASFVWFIILFGVITATWKGIIGLSKGGNSENKVESIEDQIWMTQNLNVSHFRNGVPIPHAITDEEWERAGKNKQPAWCYFRNDPWNGAKYGKLYNWFAVNDPRGLAPKGWRIPSEDNWTQLIDYLGGGDVAWGKMKETGTKHWSRGNIGATNESGFTGLPGGTRFEDGSFTDWGEKGVWWSSTGVNPYNVWNLMMGYSWGFARSFHQTSGTFFDMAALKGSGYSVRCIRDFSDYSNSIKSVNQGKILIKNEEYSTENPKSFKEAKIGNQIWMAENLHVSHFRNGDPIPHTKTNKEWEEAGENGQPAWCHYDNDPANGEKYGKLYNWFAVNDPRGLAPEGWKIPSDAEWTQLTDYLGGEDVAGDKMKEAGTSHWESPNTGASNESGFTGLPGGTRYGSGSFDGVGSFGSCWSSSEDDTIGAWGRYLYYDDGSAGRYGDDKGSGFSVRCLRD